MNHPSNLTNASRPSNPPRKRRFHLRPRTFRGKLALAIGLLVAVFLAIALALQTMLFGRIYDRSSYRLYQVASGGTLPTPDGGELYVSSTGCFYTDHTVGCGPMTPGSIMEISDSDMRGPLMQGAMWFSLALFAGFAVLAMVAAWFISRRLAGRISSLGAQMRRLDPATTGERVSIAGSDEVASLAGDVNAMLARIEQAAATQRQFIANASHELRTPIAVIGTSLDAPLAQGRFAADVEPAVRRALEADRNAADLVEGLLALSRVQNMTLHPGVERPPETSLGEAVEHALDASWNTIDERGIDVRADIDHTATVRADPTMLALLAGNLIRNAVVHNVDRGDIEVGVRTIDGDGVELSVANSTEPEERAGKTDGGGNDDACNGGGAGTDRGKGGDGRDLDDLLIPFHRGRASRLENRPGNGLGLSIVKEIADLYHAELRLARPAPGRFGVSVRFHNNHVRIDA